MASNMEKNKNYHNDTLLMNTAVNHRVKCKCGHSNLMFNVDRMICTWCGSYVYKDKQTEFKYKLKETIIKNGKRDKH